MDYSTIETFLTILKLKNITKASKALHLSQSTVTQKLKSLEEDLGVTLFIRNRGARFVELTPEGREFVTIAERYKSLLKDAHNIKNLDKNLSLTIACIDSLNSHVFSPLYKNFLDNVDIVNMTILTRVSPEIYNLVENKEADVGLVIRKSRNKNIRLEPLCEEKMILVLNSNNLYQDKEEFHPNELDLKDELYIDWGMDFQIWHNFWWNPVKDPLITVDTFSLLKVFLDSPTAWTVLPVSIAKSLSETMDLKFCDFTHKPPNRVCYKITHQHPSANKLKSIELFDNYLQEFIENLDFTI